MCLLCVDGRLSQIWSHTAQLMQMSHNYNGMYIASFLNIQQNFLKHVQKQGDIECTLLHDSS